MLDILKRIAQDVSSIRDLKETLEMVVETIPPYLDAEVCSVFLWNEQAKRFVLSANRGFDPALTGKAYLDADKGIVSAVGRKVEPLNLANAREHPAFYDIPGVSEARLHAMLAVPMLHHRKLLGVMVVQKQEEKLFGSSQESFMVTVAAQLASAVAHAEAAGYLGSSFFGSGNHNTRFGGISGASGVAIGQAVPLSSGKSLESIPPRVVSDSAAELEKFNQAVAQVRDDILSIAGKLPAEERSLLDMYIGMLDDQSLASEIVRLIDSGIWAQGAIAQVAVRYSRHFEVMEDEYLSERGADVRDIARRLINCIADIRSLRDGLPEKSIIIGEELTPAILAEVPEDRIVAIISIRGSANSHIAIMARALGIPTVMGLVDFPYHQLEGQQLVVDGYQGHVHCNLTADRRQYFERIIEEERALVAGLDYLKNEPCITLDHQRLTLQVNTGLLTDVNRSLNRGAEGVGLYRTEVAFMMRDRFPSEQEQIEIYRRQLSAFAPHGVVMRTLDIGGDKSLPYFPITEENPFLGWRGIRVTLDHPDIFLVQIRAMLRASEGLDNLSILLPMVSSVGELEEAAYHIHRATLELQGDGLDIIEPRLGMMVEVPSNLYQIRAYASRVDFLSVGSNDLIQYLLAVDRTNPRVADLYDNYHPAVWHALKKIYDDATLENTPVSICGELAGDPMAVVLLAAIGYRNLSMSPSSLLRIKAILRELNIGWARKLLKEILEMDHPSLIRSTLESRLKEVGLVLAQPDLFKM